MAQYIWPTPGNETITSGVGPRWSTVHKGIDISAPKGAIVVAAEGGKVIDVVSTCTHNYGKSQSEMKSDTCGGGYGNRIYIQHPDGQVTRYAHLSTVDVKLGDTVSQGQVIGTVGSTGQSTGDHLHFEVRSSARSDANYLDPEKYVSPSNSIVVNTPNQNISNNTNDQIDSVKSTIVSSPTTSPSGSKDQAVYAYFRLYLGDTELEYAADRPRPHIYQSMEITKLGSDGGGSTVQFVLFDDDWKKLEQLLVDNHDNIRLQYGWVDGRESDILKLRLTTYSIDLYETGVLLKVEAVSTEAWSNLNPERGLDTNTKSPTAAIKRICERMGLTVIDQHFVHTEPIEDRPENFILLNDNPLTYINEVIIPEAANHGEGLLVFYVDPGEARVAHLVRKTLNYNSYNTYIYQKGYNSEVESISFNIEGVFGGTTQLGVGSTTGGVQINSEEKSEVPQYQGQEDLNIPTDYDPFTIKIQSNQSTAIENYARDSATQILNKSRYALMNAASSQYKATMTIIGDPKIRLFDSVNILIYTDDYELYHTSGIYMVLKVMDTIEGGTYKTTLELGAHRNFDGEIAITT